jgi:hypothetical protein
VRKASTPVREAICCKPKFCVPRFEEAETLVAAAGERDRAAWRALFEVPPISMAALIALVRYAAEPVDAWGNRADSYSGIDDEPDILAAIADALERLTTTRH